MSWLAGSILGTLDLDTSPWSKGFLQTEALMQTFPASVTAFMANPLLGLVNVAQGAMSGLASAVRWGIGQITDAFNASQENADKLNDMATNAGVAVEALSGLGMAAQQAGSSTESVGDAFKFLGKNVAEATQGGKEQVALFRDLGITLTDAAGKTRPLEDIMFSLADAIAGTEDPSRRTQVAMALLGRSGTELIATLSQGSSALRDQIRTFEQYGAVVDAQAAASADAFGDLLGEVKIAWAGIQNLLAEPLRDTLSPLLRDLLDWIRSNQPQIRTLVSELVETIVSGIEVAINAIANLKAVLSGLAIGGLAGAILGGVIGGLAGGPAGIVPGVYLGGKVGAGLGAGVGYAAGSTTINLQPVDSRASTGEIARAIQDGIRAAEQNADRSTARELQRSSIRRGL